MTVRMRHTRGHTRNRRSHHALESPALAKDQAGNFHMRHRLSEVNGTYRGRKVIDLNAKLENPSSRAKLTTGQGKAKAEKVSAR